MTFSFQPHRSSSDDDSLDQHLNDWVAGSRPDPEPMSGHAADAIEFHRWADSALGTDLAATGPAAGTWNRVLRNSAQETPKGAREMSTATLGSPSTGFPSTPRESAGQSIRRYSNMAATIALVLIVAVGGWLAMSQMPDGGNGRFAALEATPEGVAQTCDVEPLSADRVIQIVKNPVPFIENGPSGEPTYISVVLPESAEFYELDDPLYIVPGNEVPTREQFEQAIATADEYMECMLHGTQGQAWNFYSPGRIQDSILAEFPVFANENEVRERIEERRELPAVEGEWLWQDLPFLDQIAHISSNPDRNVAILNSSESPYYEEVLYVGVTMRDADGAAIVHTNGTGRNLIPNDPTVTGINDIQIVVTLVKPRNGDTWLVVPYPSLNELGIPEGV